MHLQSQLPPLLLPLLLHVGSKNIKVRSISSEFLSILISSLYKHVQAFNLLILFIFGTKRTLPPFFNTKRDKPFKCSFPFPLRSEQGKEALLLTRHFSTPFALFLYRKPTNTSYKSHSFLPILCNHVKKTLTNPKRNDNWRAHQFLHHLMPWVQGILEIRAPRPHLNQTFVLGMHGSSNVYLTQKALQEIF